MSSRDKSAKKKNTLHPLLAVCITLFVISVIFSGATFAKYLSKSSKDSVYYAGSFYFSSDLLTEEGAEYTLQDDTSTITIKLKNYQDNKRSTDADIEYIIEIENGESKIGTIETTDREEDVTFDNLSPGTYVITAKSIAPYAKTLKGTFIIPESDDGFEWSIYDDLTELSIEMTMTTDEVAKEVTITWPSGVYPDNRNTLMRDATGNSYTIKMDANSSITIMFLEDEPVIVYTEKDFTVVAKDIT